MQRSSIAPLSVALMVLLVPDQSHGQWWNPFSRSDYESCSEDAAREAKTKEGLTVMLQACGSKFPARRNANGNGYLYYDPRLHRNFDVSGPVPTPSELDRIEQVYQQSLEQQRREAIQKREEEQRERQTRAKEAYRKREEEQRQQQIEAEQLRIQREEEQRQDEMRVARIAAASPKVSIIDSKIGCELSIYCRSKTGTVVIRNTSSETITSIDFGWTIFQGTDQKGCPSVIPTKTSITVRVPPGATVSADFKTDDGPIEGAFSHCIGLNGFTIAW